MVDGNRLAAAAVLVNLAALVMVSRAAAITQSRIPAGGAKRPIPAPAAYQSGSRARVQPIPPRWHGRTMLIPTRWHAQAILVRSHRSKHGHKDLAKQRRPSPAGPTTVIIGVSDSSKTVNVHVGQIVALDLNRYLNWSVVPPSSSALKPLGSLNAHSRFKAVTPGVVALRATGRPVPRPGQMTAMFIINFNVSINIQK